MLKGAENIMISATLQYTPNNMAKFMKENDKRHNIKDTPASLSAKLANALCVNAKRHA
jgi:hypothetical protein